MSTQGAKGLALLFFDFQLPRDQLRGAAAKTKKNHIWRFSGTLGKRRDSPETTAAGFFQFRSLQRPPITLNQSKRITAKITPNPNKHTYLDTTRDDGPTACSSQHQAGAFV